VGRHAAAGEHRARARPPALASADGRAVRRARRDDARDDESRTAADRQGCGDHGAVHHALDSGGGLSRRSRRRDDAEARSDRRVDDDRPAPAARARRNVGAGVRIVCARGSPAAERARDDALMLRLRSERSALRGVRDEPLPAATEEGERSERPSRAPRWLRSNKIQIFFFTIGILLVWQFVNEALRVPSYLLPTPTAIARALYSGLVDGLFIKSAFITLIEAVAGFLIAACAGIVLGTAIAQFAIVERLVYPYVVGLQSLPKVAIAPLVIVWFGYGFSSKIVVSATIAFFPVLVNVIVGLKSRS